MQLLVSLPHDILKEIIKYFSHEVATVAMLAMVSKSFRKIFMELREEKLNICNFIYSKHSLGWALSNGYKPTERLCYIIARTGNFIMLKHARKKLKCPYKENQVVLHSVAGGHTYLFNKMHRKLQISGTYNYIDQYYFENLIPEILKVAAKFGHIQLFDKYLNSLTMKSELLLYATIGNQIESVKWLYDKAFVFHSMTTTCINEARKNNYTEILTFLESKIIMG